MINNALDIAAAKQQLQIAGRVQIPQYLQDDAAHLLRHHLLHEVPWTLALRDADGSRTLDAETYRRMDDEARAALFKRTANAARGGGYHFAYDSYQMITAYQEGRDPGLLLHRILEFFNTPDYLAFARELTGEPAIRRIGAQATCYRRGQFLRQHSDEDQREGRLFAYVINLSQHWHADWGGLLHFVDTAGSITETFLPRWNALSLFRVPTEHLVSMVEPWADEERYAITGWMLR